MEDAKSVAQRAVSVSRYATPLAVALVAMGLVLSQPRGGVAAWCVSMLAVGIVFNLAMIKFLDRPEKVSDGLVRARMLVNVGVNAVLVYFLGAYWTPIWLLLALTPIAAALYGTRRDTWVSAAAISAVLLGIHALRGDPSPLLWGEQAANALFVVLVSLLINELSSQPRSR